MSISNINLIILSYFWHKVISATRIDYGVKMLLRYWYIVFSLFTACAINAQSSALVPINKLNINGILPPDVSLGYPHIQIQKKIPMKYYAPSDKNQRACLIHSVVQLFTKGFFDCGSTLAMKLGIIAHLISFFLNLHGVFL